MTLRPVLRSPLRHPMRTVFERGVGYAAALPVNTLAPSIAGDPYIGETLTATPGTWTGADSVAGEWYVNNVATGDTDTSYVIQLADVGLDITYVETATNTEGSASQASNTITAWTPASITGLVAWYDPSDLSTLFQDDAGSTPVTAVGQPVGLRLDKSGNGNHAMQGTEAARPALSALKNRLTKTDDFTHVDWIKVKGAFSGGVFTPTTENGQHQFTNNIGAVDGTQTISVEVKPLGYTVFAIKESGTIGGYAAFNLSGAGSLIAISNGTGTITPLSDGFYRITFTEVMTGLFGRTFIVCAPGYSGGDPNGSSFVGDGVSGVEIRNPQCERGTAATDYQRVNTNSDYDTVGFPRYLRFDNVDDNHIAQFGVAPGADCTITRARQGLPAQVLTGQNIGISLTINETDAGLLIYNRALTAPETAAAVAWANERGGV